MPERKKRKSRGRRRAAGSRQTASEDGGAGKTPAERLSAALDAFRRLDLSAWSLIAANLVPLAGAILLDWDVGVIVVLYWAENLVVGFYNELKMLFARVRPAGANLNKLFMMAFFLVHYGGFCAVHGMFVYLLAQGGLEGEGPDLFPSSDDWPGPLVFVGLLISVIGTVWNAYGPSIFWALVALFASHGVSFVQNYLLRGEYREAKLGHLMALPYGRIVLMHVAILAAAALVMLFGSPLPLLLILVFLKIAVDILLHLKSHSREKRSGVLRVLKGVLAKGRRE